MTACNTSEEAPQMSCPMTYSLHNFADFGFAAEVQKTFFSLSPDTGDILDTYPWICFFKMPVSSA